MGSCVSETSMNTDLSHQQRDEHQQVCIEAKVSDKAGTYISFFDFVLIKRVWRNQGRRLALLASWEDLSTAGLASCMGSTGAPQEMTPQLDIP